MKRLYKLCLVLLLAALLCACGDDTEPVPSAPTPVVKAVDTTPTPEQEQSPEPPEETPATDREALPDELLFVSVEALANEAAYIKIDGENCSLTNYEELAHFASGLLSSGLWERYSEAGFSARMSTVADTDEVVLSLFNTARNKPIRFIRDEAGLYLEYAVHSRDVRRYCAGDAETQELLEALVEAAFQNVMSAAEPEETALIYDDGSAYPLAAPLGASLAADLDGDGVTERVYQNSSSPGGKTFFSINGVDFSAALKDFGIYISWLSPENYYITDLDASDGMLEVTIYDEGPSGDPEVHFLHYSGGELGYLGSIPDSFENLEFDGKGGVEGSFRLPISHTWWGEGRWELTEKGLLEQLAQDVYYSTGDIVFYRGENGEELSHHPLAGEVYAYKSMSLDSGRTVLGTADEIRLLGTDLSEWFLVETRTGIQYWLHLTDGLLDTPNGAKSTGDIIMYLYIAG